MLDYSLFENVTYINNGERKGLLKREYPQYEDNMKSLVREFNDFSRTLVNEFNNENTDNQRIKAIGVNNTWQNSGYYNPYFWNKIIKDTENYDGIAIWISINIEGLHLSIGTTNTLESVDMNLAQNINQIFRDRCVFDIEGFENNFDGYVRYKYINDEINLDDFIRLLKRFIPIYEDVLSDYRNSQETTIINQNTDDTVMPIMENNKIKNIILYGSPGVGKTHNTKKLISLIESGHNERDIFQTIKDNELNNNIDANRIVENISHRVKFITFHQSFGYEDFIEGFRPNENGNIKLQDGIFKSICNDADNDREHSYYLVIDEINRGNISKIFGELITLIEEDKRDTLEVTLPYSKKPFKIPSNLYIIGTMNSTDKSIALIDIALRRRFTFLKMDPNLDLIDNVKAKNIMKSLNEKITETLGVDYVLGHSYFMKIENDDELDFVLEYKIKPLLEEYFYGDEQGLKSVMEIVKYNGDDDTE